MATVEKGHTTTTEQLAPGAKAEAPEKPQEDSEAALKAAIAKHGVGVDLNAPEPGAKKAEPEKVTKDKP